MPKVTVDVVLRRLKKLYPDARCTLDWTNPFELLIATILATQCTDKRVNIVTKSLFKKYKTPQDYLAVPQEELEKDVHSCGTFRMKAKAIQVTCKTLLDEFDGQVPRTMDGMLKLRGVGRKIASVVLSTAFGLNEGIPVDTHVIRVSQKIGLTKEKVQGKIEKDLMKKTPRKEWANLSHLLVFHGRNACHARASKEQCLAFME